MHVEVLLRLYLYIYLSIYIYVYMIHACGRAASEFLKTRLLRSVQLQWLCPRVTGTCGSYLIRMHGVSRGYFARLSRCRLHRTKRIITNFFAPVRVSHATWCGGQAGGISSFEEGRTEEDACIKTEIAPACKRVSSSLTCEYAAH